MATYQVTTSNNSFEFDTQLGEYNTALLIDSTHVVNIWRGSSTTSPYAQVFTVNTTTWAVTTAGDVKEIINQAVTYPTAVLMDSNHFFVFHTIGTSLYVNSLEINTTTWAITTASSAFEFDTSAGSKYPWDTVKIDNTHFISVFQGIDGDGFAQVFTVNTTTWAVTTASSSFEFDTSNGATMSMSSIDNNHFLVIFQGVASDGFAQVLEVNTTTWAVTTASSAFEFDTQNCYRNDNILIDSTHFCVAWNFATKLKVQILEINTTTWAITTSGSVFEAYNGGGSYITLNKFDSNRLICFFSESTGSDGMVHTLHVNTSTWAITTTSNNLEFDESNATYNSTIKLDTNHFINFWSGADSDGFVQVFEVELPTTLIKTINGLAKASVKSKNGLAIASIKNFNGLA